VAVSKTQPAEAVIAAAELGITDFGENRVQEAARKIPVVRATLTGCTKWHMVGQLQSNKVATACKLFDILHSVDSERLGALVARRAITPMPVLMEVDFSNAPGRAGVSPSQLKALAHALAQFPMLDVRGLMTVAPLGLAEADLRAVFRRLRELRDELRAHSPPLCGPELSMGMTDDFELAIAEGSTMVRIGRAIFGERV